LGAVNVIVQVLGGAGRELIVIVNLFGSSSVLPPVALQPAENETAAPAGVLPMVTSNGVPTAALVGAEVIANVLAAKVAVTFLFCVTLVNAHVAPVQSPLNAVNVYLSAANAVQVLLPPLGTGFGVQSTVPPPVGTIVTLMSEVHPVLIVVVTLEDPARNSNTSPLKEFPVNACAVQVLTLHALGRVALTFIVQLHATGEQPAFMTLGMFATQIELGGTATVWPRLFTVVAGQLTLFPP
jgi:hypothetical protein